MKIFKYIFLLLTPFLFTGCDELVWNTGDPQYYVYTFSNFETILTIVGLSLASFMFVNIFGPLAFSIIGFLYIKKLFDFLFSAFANKNAESNEFFDGSAIMNIIMSVFAITVLMIKVPVGIKAISATPSSAAADKSWAENDYKSVIGQWTLKAPKRVTGGDTSNSLFGEDHWFSSGDKTYSEIIGSVKTTAGSQFNSDMKFYIPLVLVLPMSIADTLLYGDGTDGILMNYFPDTYPLLVHDPGFLFKIMSENDPGNIQEDNKQQIEVHSKIIKTLIKTDYQLNRDFAFMISNYNLMPYTALINYQTKVKQVQNEITNSSGSISAEREALVAAEKNYNLKLAQKIQELFPDSSFRSQLKDLALANSETTLKDDNIDLFKKYPELSLGKVDKYVKLTFDKSQSTYPNYFSGNLQPINEEQFFDIVGKVSVFGNITDNDAGGYSTIQSSQTGKNSYEMDPMVLPIDADSNVPFKDSGLLYFDFYNNSGNKYKFDNINSEMTYGQGTWNKNMANSFTAEIIEYQKKIFDTYSIQTPDKKIQKVSEFRLNPINNNSGKDQYINNYITKFENEFPQLSSTKSTVPFATHKMYDKLREAKKELDKLYQKEFIEFYAKTYVQTGKAGSITEEDFIKKINDTLLPNIKNINDRMNVAEGHLKMNNEELKNNLSQAIRTKLENEWLNTLRTNTDSTTSEEVSGGLLGTLGSVFPNVSEGFESDSGAMGMFGQFLWLFVTWFVGLVINILALIAKLILAPLYGFVFAMHTLGILMLLFMFPLSFFGQVIIGQDYTKLYQPFKDYLAYRLWDFAVLLTTEIMVILGPVMISVFEKMNPMITALFNIFFLFGIFMVTGHMIKGITEAVGGKDQFNLFNSVAKAGTKVATGAAAMGVVGGTALAVGTAGVAGKGLGAISNGLGITGVDQNGRPTTPISKLGSTLATGLGTGLDKLQSAGHSLMNSAPMQSMGRTYDKTNGVFNTLTGQGNNEETLKRMYGDSNTWSGKVGNLLGAGDLPTKAKVSGLSTPNKSSVSSSGTNGSSNNTEAKPNTSSRSSSNSNGTSSGSNSQANNSSTNSGSNTGRDSNSNTTSNANGWSSTPPTNNLPGGNLTPPSNLKPSSLTDSPKGPGKFSVSGVAGSGLIGEGLKEMGSDMESQIMGSNSANLAHKIGNGRGSSNKLNENQTKTPEEAKSIISTGSNNVNNKISNNNNIKNETKNQIQQMLKQLGNKTNLTEFDKVSKNIQSALKTEMANKTGEDKRALENLKIEIANEMGDMRSNLFK